MLMLMFFLNLFCFILSLLVVDTGFVKTRFINEQTGIEMLKVSCHVCFRFSLF
jgi:hypothetical protein